MVIAELWMLQNSNIARRVTATRIPPRPVNPVIGEWVAELANFLSILSRTTDLSERRKKKIGEEGWQPDILGFREKMCLHWNFLTNLIKKKAHKQYIGKKMLRKHWSIMVVLEFQK